MSQVRIQELPLLPTFIIRGYPQPDMELMADFSLVSTMQQDMPQQVWMHGMKGVSNYTIWRAIGQSLLERDVRYVRARRAPNRVLPRGETMPDGSLRIDLERLLSRGRDTGFASL